MHVDHDAHGAPRRYYGAAEAAGAARAAEAKAKLLGSSLWREHLDLKARYPERPIEDYPELHRLMKNEDRRVKRFPHLKNFLGPTLPGADYIPGRDDDDGPGQGSKRVRNSQLQRLLSRPFSTRFG